MACHHTLPCVHTGSLCRCLHALVFCLPFRVSPASCSLTSLFLSSSYLPLLPRLALCQTHHCYRSHSLLPSWGRSPLVCSVCSFASGNSKQRHWGKPRGCDPFPLCGLLLLLSNVTHSSMDTHTHIHTGTHIHRVHMSTYYMHTQAYALTHSLTQAATHTHTY